VINTKSIPILN